LDGDGVQPAAEPLGLTQPRQPGERREQRVLDDVLRLGVRAEHAARERPRGCGVAPAELGERRGLARAGAADQSPSVAFVMPVTCRSARRRYDGAGVWS
jgi:hypothetical protein